MHHRLLVHVCEQLARGCYPKVRGRESNPRLLQWGPQKQTETVRLVQRSDNYLPWYLAKNIWYPSCPTPNFFLRFRQFPWPVRTCVGALAPVAILTTLRATSFRLIRIFGLDSPLSLITEPWGHCRRMCTRETSRLHVWHGSNEMADMTWTSSLMEVRWSMRWDLTTCSVISEMRDRLAGSWRVSLYPSVVS